MNKIIILSKNKSIIKRKNSKYLNKRINQFKKM